MSKNDREFNLPDAELTEHADVVVATLPSDMPFFTAFDSTFNVEYIFLLQNAIADVENYTTNEVMMDEMAEHSLDFKNKWNICYQQYQTIAYFARKAFATNPAILNQFGTNDIDKAQDSQPKMVVFMKSLVKTVYKYETQLVEAGCNQMLLINLPDNVLAFHESNIAQEKFKNDRALNTQERVKKLNLVYRLLQPLHKAAVIIFKNDPVRYQIYTMPQPSPLPETPEIPVLG